MNKLSISSCLSNTTVSEYKSVVHIKWAVLALSMYLNQEHIQKLLMGLDIQKHAGSIESNLIFIRLTIYL